MKVLNFSIFAKKIYLKPGIKSIESQHRFIGELFHAGGSTFFPKSPNVNDSCYWSTRSLYSGKRSFTDEMKASFPLEIDEKKFASHFTGRFKSRALTTIMNNFLINDPDPNEELFLIALCRQFQRIINDEDESGDVVKNEYEGLIDYMKQETLANNISNGNKPHANSELIAKTVNAVQQLPPQRLWLPDAEFATEEQSEFASFTMTNSICNFVNPEGDIWGIRSAKGVGKTYLLQKLRRDMNKYAIPHHRKLSKDNEWGTESIRFENPVRLENAGLKQLAVLWQVSILCLIINCYENTVEIDEQKLNRLPNNLIYLLKNPKSFACLNDIMNEVLTDEIWYNTILDSYTVLKSHCKQVMNIHIENSDNHVAIFIDKVDQSILQPGAEIPECNACYKDSNYEKCKDPKKDSPYCLEQCRECCYGCEKFSSPYAGSELRVYGSGFGKRYEHISRWQHLQLALVYAVYTIGFDFNSRIKVYYSIRQEAFNAEENLLGANAHKIKAHSEVLYYSKDEQEKIFINTIRVQPPDYLFNPRLIGENGNDIEAFVGINRLCHPYVVDETESLFDCIYRHSFDRAREIQYYGEALSLKTDELRRTATLKDREERVKEIIENTAADLVFRTAGVSASGNRTYYSDKQILLRNYWANPGNFKNFIEKIDRNLLFIDNLADICKKVNSNPDCDYNNCNESSCKLHPFSMLHQMGLLGRAAYNTSTKRVIEQNFVDSKDITYYRDGDNLFPNNDTLFILHPALTKCIEKNIRRTSIKHFNGFILGKSLSVPTDIFIKLLEDKQSMNADLFETKYYSNPITISKEI